MMERTQQPTTTEEALPAKLAGRVIRPGDAAYDQARRVWNGMIDRYPALIARCTTPEEVVAAVTYARESGLPLSVRGGGHNVAGHGTNDGGVVIDLSAMNQVTVDAERRLVRAGGGTTIAQLDAETQRYGLAVPMGVVAATGIAGLTLGGGYGWLRNKFGLSCDNLVGATMVTAAGRVVQASAGENPDLLWGLRGGGGNFGVVTEFVYQAHPVGPEVAFAFVLHDAEGERMAEAIRFYRDFSATAPDEVSTVLSLGVVPADEHLFPADIHGRRFALFAGLYAGAAEDGLAALRPLIAFDGQPPLVDFSGIMPYVEVQTLFDADYPDGLRYYWKSLNLSRLDDEAIGRIAAHARQQPSPLSTTDIWHIGGAMTRAGVEESAFYGRHAAFLLNPEANWEDAQDDQANVQWVRSLLADMQPFSDGSRYLNFAGFEEEGDEMMQRAFGPHYRRLAALKQTYDPDNLFRLNQNVRPASRGG
jgi:FAD/FMN-containing dehydrogenase